MNKKIIIFVIFILGLIGSYRLFRPGYFSMQDDIHIFRLQQFDKCVSDFQIPCRMIPDGGMGYGYPLFNFYPPAPYALAEIFHLVGFSFINSIKIVFIATSLIRPLGMFLLSSFFFGPAGGLISAILFALAPYQATNSFVRGAIAENLSLSLIPFVLWFLLKRRYFLFSISLSLLALSHNLTLLYALPLLLIFSFSPKQNTKKTIVYTLLGLVGASFFLIPAFFEKQLTTVNTMTQGYFYFVNHFATLKQLFINHNDWGYGASLWGPVDDMSFQIGYLQWILPAIAVLLIIKSKIKNKTFFIFLFLLGIFCLFLTHNKSTFIWQIVPFLSFYQFPWRFLAPAIFCFSLISGFLGYKIIAKKYRIIFISLLLTIEIILNFSFFKEDIWYPALTDQQKLSGENLVTQSGAGLKDYWPKYGQNFPLSFAPVTPSVLTGNATIISFSKISNSATSTIDVSSENALVVLPIVYFPNYKVIINENPSSYLIDRNLGLINLDLSTGKNNIKIIFFNTPIRTISNLISIFSFIGLGLFYIYRHEN